MRFDYDGEGDSAGGSWEPDRPRRHGSRASTTRSPCCARAASPTFGSSAFASARRWRTCTRPRIPESRASRCGGRASAARHTCASFRALSRSVERGASGTAGHGRPVPRGFARGLRLRVHRGDTRRAREPRPRRAARLRVSVPSVLLIDRHDAPPSELLVRRLVDSGSHVEHEQMAGYAEFMIDDGDKSVLPRPILQRITDWLATTLPGTAAAEEPATDEPEVVEKQQIADRRSPGRTVPAAGTGAEHRDRAAGTGSAIGSSRSCRARPTPADPPRRDRVVHGRVEQPDRARAAARRSARATGPASASRSCASTSEASATALGSRRPA